jgi:cell division protein FtsB
LNRNTKNALTNDLVEGLEKDLEKLKQKEKNITHRMRTLEGDKTVNEREEDVELKRFFNLDRQL